MATPQKDLIDDIITDHREVENAFKQIENTKDIGIRRQLVEQVVTELVRHSVAEEQYLYPTTRRVLPDGDEIADHELEEHATAEEIMKQLQRIEGQAEDVEFSALVRKLIKEVRHHIEEEEAGLLPKLRNACDAAELGELGEKFENTKKVAPTRPHPLVPDKPPANKILGPGVGLIDRMRDALTGRKS
jgi:hemerythrin superfamily protein